MKAKAQVLPRSAAGHVAANANLLCFEDWAPDLQKARVYEQILLDIILGALSPNTLLEEKTLAKRYSAGLAGIRDALGRLSLEGLVVRRPRAGTNVSGLDLNELRQDYEARMLIEPECAAMAAIYGGPEDFSAIKAAFQNGAAAARDNDRRALVAMDQRFHAAIARATGNASLARILIPLQHRAARFWVFSMESSKASERLADVAEHQKIADLIERKNPHSARAAMQHMLSAMPDALLRSVSNR